MRGWLALLALALTAAAPGPEDATLIRGARVFDGTGARPKVRDVLIRGDRIIAIGRHLKAGDAQVIDAAGLTLIPGLHDLHIHTEQGAFADPQAFARAYSPYLARGITSVNEYSVSGPMLEGIRAMPGPAPHVALAIRLGVPGGHGTESRFTDSITTQVTNPAEAHAAMANALRYRPDLIKVFADGWRYGDPARPDKPSMDLPTLAAIVADAHRAHVPVVTHTVTLAGAKIAARAGVDSVVHGIGDALVDAEMIGLMKRHRMGYVATLVVFEPQQDRSFLPEELRVMAPADRAREEARMTRPLAPIEPYDSKRWAIMQENIRRLRAAHIRIGVGTDTGIDGVDPGWSAIREIRWLVTLGFTPREALAAATSVSADIMRQRKDHGRIARGMRADLALIGGRPDERIVDLYDVRRVWVSGREVPRQSDQALSGAR